MQIIRHSLQPHEYRGSGRTASGRYRRSGERDRIVLVVRLDYVTNQTSGVVIFRSQSMPIAQFADWVEEVK